MLGTHLKRTEIWGYVTYYTGLGLMIPAGMIAGVLLGWEFDRLLHASPVFEVMLAAAGAVTGLLEVMRKSKKFEARAGTEAGGGGS
jgi:F0F1-type ATP synthase assembly protein I